MKLRRSVIILLLLPLLVPVAGATYLQGSDIPTAYDEQTLYELASSSGLSTPPAADPGGPVKKYLSSDPNDYVLVPGNDPDRMYALGDTPTEAQPVAISAPVNVPSRVDTGPSITSVRPIATSTSSATVLPPSANATSGTYIPPVSGLQHPNAIGYDTSTIGRIIPSVQDNLAKKGPNIGIPEFKFPALFG